MLLSKHPHTRRFLNLAANGAFVGLVAGVVVFAFMHGMARQQEIDERADTDFCRAHPAACDMPAPSSRGQ